MQQSATAPSTLIPLASNSFAYAQRQSSVETSLLQNQLVVYGYIGHFTHLALVQIQLLREDGSKINRTAHREPYCYLDPFCSDTTQLVATKGWSTVRTKVSLLKTSITAGILFCVNIREPVFLPNA